MSEHPCRDTELPIRRAGWGTRCCWRMKARDGGPRAAGSGGRGIGGARIKGGEERRIGAWSILGAVRKMIAVALQVLRQRF